MLNFDCIHFYNDMFCMNTFNENIIISDIFPSFVLSREPFNVYFLHSWWKYLNFIFNNNFSKTLIVQLLNNIEVLMNVTTWGNLVWLNKNDNSPWHVEQSVIISFFCLKICWQLFWVTWLCEDIPLTHRNYLNNRII